MRAGAAKRAPAPTAPRPRRPDLVVAQPAAADGSRLAVLVAELVAAIREEARGAVREALAAERAREPGVAPDGWLSTADVARRLGRSEKTVRHWITVRGLPAQKHLGVWRVRERDLDAFITGAGDTRERSVAASILATLHAR